MKVDVSNIHITNDTWEVFLETHPETDDTILFADPPYLIDTYLYGKDGDLHEAFDHKSFATEIQKRKDWFVC